MIIAQLSDLHLRPRGEPYNRVLWSNAAAERALRAVARLRPAPDLVIATGDIAEKGLADEYATFLALQKHWLPGGAHVIPGNHDDRENLVAALNPPVAATGFVDYVIEAGPVRVVMLDTLVPGSSAGALREAQLGWLEARLAEAPDAPTLIGMHHPPFLTHIGHMDRIGLQNADAFAAVVARHRQIERIVCGHAHRQIVARIGGAAVIVSPSTVAAVALDLKADAPANFVGEPGQFNLHVWSQGQGFVTHTAFVEDFEGPYPFVG